MRLPRFYEGEINFLYYKEGYEENGVQVHFKGGLMLSCIKQEKNFNTEARSCPFILKWLAPL